MNKRLFFISWFTLSSMAGWADVDIEQQDFGSENISQPAKRTPFSLEMHEDFIWNSKIRKGRYKDDKVRFATADIQAGMIVYYNPDYSEGLRVALGYIPTYLRWSENPWFEQEHFDTVTLTLGGFSKRFDDWFWRSQLTINFDANDWSSAYTSYDLLLWGRYSYCDNVGIHIGFWAETGLQMDRVYPVLGFDWIISPKWKLNLVYPVNVALEYSVTKSWTLAIAARFFDCRFRVSRDESSPKHLVRYTNAGAEFAIKYDIDVISANIHAGTTFGGKYREADRNNHHAHNFKLKPSAYIGGEVDVKF